MSRENMEAEGVREFHIGDILSITTGRLVSPRHMDGIYDILNYMTGDDLFTHQLPRAAEECEEPLRSQHPDLDEVEVPDGLQDKEKFTKFLGEVAAKHGETRPVLPLNPAEHNPINPIEELCDMVGTEKVFVFDPTKIDDPES